MMLQRPSPLLKKALVSGEPAEKAVAAFYLGQIHEDRGADAEAIAYYRQVVSGGTVAAAQIRVANLLVKQGGGLSMAIGIWKPPQYDTRRHASSSRSPRPSCCATPVARQRRWPCSKNRWPKQPNQPEVLYDAAMLAERPNRMDLVEGCNLRRVIVLRPDNAHAYNALGYSFADRGIRLDEARDLIAQALALARTILSFSIAWAG